MCRGDFAGRGLLSMKRMGVPVVGADAGYGYCWRDGGWGAAMAFTGECEFECRSGFD